MKLGFVSAILAERSLEQVLQFAASEGFETVELMSWPLGKAERKYAGVTHVDVTDLTVAQASDLLALARQHDVEISALGYYPNVLDPDPTVAEPAIAHLKKVIAAAPLLGLDTVNTFVGRDWKRSVEENWPRFLEVWKPLIAFAEERQVRVGIENCPMYFTDAEWPSGKNLASSPAIWRRMFEDIPSDFFGLNYDPSHLAFQFMDYERPLGEFGDKLFHLHAKDVKIQHALLDEVGIFAEPLKWHQPRIPGFGEIDWAHYMGSVREAGYDGPVCIEVEDETFGKSLEGRQQALRTARNVLRPYFG